MAKGIKRENQPGNPDIKIYEFTFGIIQLQRSKARPFHSLPKYKKRICDREFQRLPLLNERFSISHHPASAARASIVSLFHLNTKIVLLCKSSNAFRP
ncbi:hypothetical protein [Fictibacillus sp. S7]|uniref:hypothetical protein n=1 Tax=Fictibacillus sp. S7 TaxID=2212476 RepID=UPI0019D71B04|nr:hypothetical protein [Fictibacillus sp. S7]